VNARLAPPSGRSGRGAPRSLLLPERLLLGLLLPGLLLLALLPLSLGTLSAASAGEEGGDGGGEYVLIVGRAYLGSGPTPEVGPIAVVVRDGRIAAVERDLDRIPADLPRIEHRDAYLTPGLVAAATDLPGAHQGDESLGAAFRAIDGFDRYGDYRPWLAQGITLAHLSPGEHRLLSGEGAIVRLAGAPDARVIAARADLCLQLGDPADAPPPIIEFPFPPSSDVAIEPARPQRPESRLGRLLGLEEELARALAGEGGDLHTTALAEVWRAERPLRIAADRATDLLAAVSFLRAQERRGVVVGGAEIASVAATFAERGTPVIYRPRTSARTSAPDDGLSLDAVRSELPDFHSLRQSGVELVLGPARGGPIEDLRFSAILARRAGLDRETALRAITDGAADALGLGDRFGRIAPGHAADFVLWNMDPLAVSARPLEVVVAGRSAYRAEVATGVTTRATVVRAGTIWVSDERVIHDGELLIEDGAVVAVGASVPRPPHARIIDAGPGAFVTPGFIDARGHLGLRGDRGRAGLDVRFGGIVGVPDRPEERVARSGVTTVLLSPYALSSAGSTIAAVKTWGADRGTRLVREVAAVAFALGGDPLTVLDPISRQVGRAKKYIEQWQKYEKALAEWEEKSARGEATKPSEEVVEEVETKVDPVTGIWEGTVSGGPLPEPQSGKLTLRLTGNSVEGKIIEPPVPVDHRIVATLEGTTIRGTIEADIDMPATPEITAELDGEDSMKGTISVMGFNVELVGRRVSREAAETSVTRRRKVREDGRPVAPKVDPGLEAMRALVEKKIPAVVEVSGRNRVAAVVEYFAEKEKLPLVLAEAEGATKQIETLAKGGVGVIVPLDPVLGSGEERLHPSDRLSRGAVPIALQSRAEDGARELASRVLYAVDQGLAADAALAALTCGPARMYRIDDRVGTLEPGRDGDLLIFRGHPFRDGGRLERVFIDGEEVPR